MSGLSVELYYLFPEHIVEVACSILQLFTLIYAQIFDLVELVYPVDEVVYVFRTCALVEVYEEALYFVMYVLDFLSRFLHRLCDFIDLICGTYRGCRYSSDRSDCRRHAYGRKYRSRSDCVTECQTQNTDGYGCAGDYCCQCRDARCRSGKSRYKRRVLFCYICDGLKDPDAAFFELIECRA